MLSPGSQQKYHKNKNYPPAGCIIVKKLAGFSIFAAKFSILNIIIAAVFFYRLI
jgi:hypothetical protein